MKKNLFIAAAALVALVSCSDESFVGNNSPTNPDENGTEAIVFTSNAKGLTRADFIGATAAEKLGNMFVVEGTKGSEQSNSPSTTVVFDNYLVGYTANSAGKTESNTNNWEYVGLQSGITTPLRMSSDTWNSLHSGDGRAKSQTVKYWDYSTSQYDFYAYSTGTCEAVPVPSAEAAPTNGTIQVSRINQVTTEAPTGFTMRAARVEDLKQCYYTDINKVPKASYGQPVTLTFRNMTAKVRIALYETVPGYSVKNVEFYQAEASDPTAPDDLASTISSNPATLFTMGDDKLPQCGIVTVLYPRVGISSNTAADYNKASVTISPDASTVTKQEFGTLTAQYTGKEGNEVDNNIYLGRDLPHATYAGLAANNFYQDVIPCTTGMPLTLRLNYTLVSTDGSSEEIKVYGAKAVVPATYTKWLPNYAYTYVFKISDNSNGYTSTLSSDPKGLFPITFDAVVTSFTDYNAEQTTVTTVATPSITTYQQGHDHANKDEYSKSQKAGADDANAKKLYVQVMDNSGATPTLKADLNVTKKSLLFAATTTGAPISEATVMDAMQNRTNAYGDDSPVGRNGITLTTNGNIVNTVTSIVNGVDDQPVTVTANTTAEIAIASLDAGTYAYVYSTTVPSSDEAIYNVVNATSENYTNYYTVGLTGSETPIASTDDATLKVAQAGKVYFVKNVDAKGAFVSYTFKQTKVGESVVGLVSANIPVAKASGGFVSTNFYFDVYNQNNGSYAVKVFKVVN